MIDPIVLLAFVPAALALNLTPGADMMFCLAQGLRAGARPAIAASAGVAAGGMVHVSLAGLGLAAIMVQFPWLLDALQWLGAGYLLWLAYRALTTPLAADQAPLDAAAPRPLQAFRDGMIVSLANPKVILFILAFVPQFITPTAPVLPQFLIFGGILSFGGFVINGAVGLGAGHIGRHILTNPRIAFGLRTTVAALFGGLAARIGWEALRG